MGLNRNFPWAVAFATDLLGGLDLRLPSIKQGFAQLKKLMNHVYNNTVAGQMILIAIDNLQLEAGTKRSIFTEPSYLIP